MTNGSPTGSPHLGEIQKPESPALTLVHQISRYDLHHKRKRFSLGNRGENSTNILTNTTTEPTHKI